MHMPQAALLVQLYPGSRLAQNVRAGGMALAQCPTEVPITRQRSDPTPGSESLSLPQSGIYSTQWPFTLLCLRHSALVVSSWGAYMGDLRGTGHYLGWLVIQLIQKRNLSYLSPAYKVHTSGMKEANEGEQSFVFWLPVSPHFWSYFTLHPSLLLASLLLSLWFTEQSVSLMSSSTSVSVKPPVRLLSFHNVLLIASFLLFSIL